MKIKFKHILLFIIICILIYLDYKWYLNTDLTLNEKGKLKTEAENFVIMNLMLTVAISIFIIIFTNIAAVISNILNKTVFKL